MNPDPYYQRKEVSNSDLTALREILHPRLVLGDRTAAFRFGTLVDAMVTEPARVNLYERTVDGERYGEDEFRRAQSMTHALRAEAGKDSFLDTVLRTARMQKVSVREGQSFEFCGFPFTLDTRCKWDFWLGRFGGDLKTTSAATQGEFEEAVDTFDWDRSRAWYMDLVGSDMDFIYGVSKKNGRVFRKFIRRGDETYERGREKYLELAFQWWMLNPRKEAE
ncbi:MAG: PD-(D/E)XK nuclease-like domain-containing protein [Bacteroidales bacterium]|nr:PD-(D/E)XK nuclease-like domain-containing protein [Bacteroidales bacterium]